MTIDVNFMIGGEAGQGVQSVGFLLAKAFARTTYVIENNATGQLAHLIQAETGRKISHRILKYDGRPLTPEYIINEIKKGE